MKKLLIIFLTVLTVVSCKDLTELNQDAKNPDEVPSGALFANATVELFDWMASTNVNRNVWRLWAQHWTETTYTDEANYILTERDINGFVYVVAYTRVLRDLQEARTVLETEVEEDVNVTEEHQRNRNAIFSVMEVYTWHLLVDIFGDVPYTEALDRDIVAPAYDPGSDIYDAIIAKLDAAINDLSGESALGSDDLIYGGDVSLWRKAANTLKLKLAIRTADVNTSRSKTMAEAAFTDGIISSPAEDFMVGYSTSTPNTNPLWEDLVQSGRNDFVLANTLVDHMNSLDDPRMDDYMICPCDSAGNYVGGVFGAGSSYPQFSHITPTLLDPTFPHTLIDYTETQFLLADAAERGYSVGGTAVDYYDAAVTASIMDWGGTQVEATTYLAHPDVVYATGDWRERIGMQKWIAMYNRGFEAWTTWRLYDAPVMNVAPVAGTVPPVRFIYPVDEFSLNGANVSEAAGKYGNNSGFSPVFWDVN